MVATAATTTRPPKIKIKYCRACGIDITERGRRAYMCVPCALVKMKADKNRLYLQAARDRRKRSCDTSRAVGLEYEHQFHSRDGKYYIIPAVNKSNYRVLKVCQVCHKDDEMVRGWWGPIFSTFNAEGRELELVLLCLHCYQAACSSSGLQEKRYA